MPQYLLFLLIIRELVIAKKKHDKCKCSEVGSTSEQLNRRALIKSVGRVNECRAAWRSESGRGYNRTAVSEEQASKVAVAFLPSIFYVVLDEAEGREAERKGRSLATGVCKPGMRKMNFAINRI